MTTLHFLTKTSRVNSRGYNNRPLLGPRLNHRIKSQNLGNDQTLQTTRRIRRGYNTTDPKDQPIIWDQSLFRGCRYLSHLLLLLVACSVVVVVVTLSPGISGM